jgi:cyclase
MLILVGALSVMLAQQQPPRVVEVEKLKDNLYLLKGSANTVVFIMSNGVTVVDTKDPGWGQPILDKIKELTNKPVTTVINTHTHGDHVSGNVEFPASVDIIVQENTKTNMAKMLPSSAFPDEATSAKTIFQQHGGRGLPKRTFKDKMILFKGADEIDLFYFGRGHTNGDAWVLFPALRVVHAGDIVAGKRLPSLDANNGGSAAQIADTLEKAYNALVKSADIISTGHSTSMTFADLKDYTALNREFYADARAAKKAGKSIEEMVASWKIPTKYSLFAPPDAARLRNNLTLAYAELDKSSNH